MLKEKIIEQIKKFKLYHLIKKIIYQTKDSAYKKEFLNDVKANDYIKELLISDNPNMITRYGSIELKIIENYLKNGAKGYEEAKKIALEYKEIFHYLLFKNLKSVLN